MFRFLKKRLNSKMIFYFMVLLIIFLCFSSIVMAPPPVPKNVKGKVYTNSSNGVENGIPVKVNDTTNGNWVLTYVYAPPIPALRGSYSTTIDGSTGDLVVVTAWNNTHYGVTEGTLVETTTTIDVILNITRSSEANVTIIEPDNNTLKNKSIVFNVTANISIWGNDGLDCNATISFSDNNVINITSDETFVHQLDNIARSDYKVTNWSVVGINNGVSNITVDAICSNSGIVLENLDRDTVYNITIQNLAPTIDFLYLDDEIDLLIGGNLTVLCNATVSDYNTVSDISLVNGTLFMESVGHNADDDKNYHYTNSSCVNISSDRFTANYSCGFKVAYYANNGTWQCNVTVVDLSDSSDYSNKTTLVNELLAFDVVPSIIDYGNLQSSNISLTDVNITVMNLGNVGFNISVSAFAPNQSMGYLNLSMTCPTGNISNAYQRYSVKNGSTFNHMTRMNNESQMINNITLYQRTNDLGYGNDTNMTYWKLEIPPLIKGACNGSLMFGTIVI